MEKPPVIPAAQELQLTKYLETISVNILQTQLHMCEDLLIFMQFLQEKLICNFSCKNCHKNITIYLLIFKSELTQYIIFNFYLLRHADKTDKTQTA